MFLSIAVDGPEAADLSFLLYKHPDRVFRSDESKNSKMRAVGFYPEYGALRAEFHLSVEVDPVERVRGLSWNAGIAQYVEPQPFLAASYMAQALSLCLRSAMNGIVGSKDPEEDARLKRLAGTELHLTLRVGPLRTSVRLIERMFLPLGWSLSVDSTPLDVPGGRRESDLHVLTLTGRATVSTALTQLYVLLPALDPKRHYFYDESEVSKLIDKSRGWLEGHPDRELIVSRYLSKSRELREAAMAGLEGSAEDAATPAPEEERAPQAHDLRHDRIMAVVSDAVGSGARRIADLGCGEGRLLQKLVRLPGDVAIIGLEPGMRDLEKARRALERNPARQMDPRVELLHGSILYADRRLSGVDVAILSEVVEHIDPERLTHAERSIFGYLAPRTVIVTTPNRSYNAVFGLGDAELRHSDHRFEWTRDEAGTWASGVAAEHGYTYSLTGVGSDEHPEHGHLSHMIVFEKEFSR